MSTVCGRLVDMTHPRPPDPQALVPRLFTLMDMLRSRFETVVESGGITPQQFQILSLLDRPRDQTWLADALSCDKSNVAGLVRRMEDGGWITRAVDPDDHRRRLVSRSDAGEQLHDEIETALFDKVPGLHLLDEAGRTQLAMILDAMKVPPS